MTAAAGPAAPGARRLVTLVARREFLTRVRGTTFLVTTGVLLAVLVGYAILLAVLSGGPGAATVTVAPETAALRPALADAARTQGVALTVVPAASAAEGTARAHGGHADAALSGPAQRPRVDVAEKLDGPLRGVVAAAVARLAAGQALAAHGVDPGPVLAGGATPPEVVALHPPDPARGERLALGAFGAFLLFFSLQSYGGLVAQGVVEEKQSRVVELVLAAVRPWQLLLGKVLGLGAVGLLQLLVLIGAGLGAATVGGLLTAGVPLLGPLLAVLGWYLLGFALYATVYAALGSLVSRQEDTQLVLTPVTVLVLVGFVAGFNLLLEDPHGTVVTVLSLVPPYSPLLMPGRIAAGVAPAWQVALAVVLTLGFTAGVLVLGGRIYSRSVLRTGARVSLLDALRRG